MCTYLAHILPILVININVAIMLLHVGGSTDSQRDYTYTLLEAHQKEQRQVNDHFSELKYRVKMDANMVQWYRICLKLFPIALKVSVCISKHILSSQPYEEGELGQI